ncbi:MAG: hypothetical protein KAJ47_03865, partial [Candidatus Aenigmarchaeota archaeon]|nr:hypothetical protein [Candidatus Aenigmarchaeota archaeon]
MNSYTKTFRRGNDILTISPDEIKVNFNDNEKILIVRGGGRIEAYAKGENLEDANDNLNKYFKIIAKDFVDRDIKILNIQKYVPQEMYHTSTARRDLKVDCDLLKEFYEQYNKPNKVNSKGIESQKNKITPLVLSSIFGRPSKKLPIEKESLSSAVEENIFKNNGRVDFRYGQNY